MIDIFYVADQGVIRVTYTDAGEYQNALAIRWALLHLFNRDLGIEVRANRVRVTRVQHPLAVLSAYAPRTPPNSPVRRRRFSG